MRIIRESFRSHSSAMIKEIEGGCPGAKPPGQVGASSPSLIRVYTMSLHVLKLFTFCVHMFLHLLKCAFSCLHMRFTALHICVHFTYLGPCANPLLIVYSHNDKLRIRLDDTVCVRQTNCKMDSRCLWQICPLAKNQTTTGQK